MQTLATIRSEVLYRLNDADAAVWAAAEVDRYIREAYADFCARTKLLWSRRYLDDEAGVATVELPVDLVAIERATWNLVPLEPLSRPDAESWDARYETTQGDVIAFVLEGDALNVLRKVRVPAVGACAVEGEELDRRIRADEFEREADGLIGAGSRKRIATIGFPLWPWGLPRGIAGTWGIPRSFGDPSIVSGSWGIPRGHACAVERNTVIEYWRRGAALEAADDAVELPDNYVKFIRYYAMARALERNGPGNDFEGAKLYRALYDAGLQRVKRQREKRQRQARVGRMGEEGESRGSRPPRPRLPANYRTPWR